MVPDDGEVPDVAVVPPALDVPPLLVVPPALDVPPLLVVPPLAVVPPVPLAPPFELLVAVVVPPAAELEPVVPPDFDEPPLALVPPVALVVPPKPEDPPELDAWDELDAPPELDDPLVLLPPEEDALLLFEEPPEDDEPPDADDPPWAPLELLPLEPALLFELLPCDDPVVSSAPHPARAIERSTVEPNRTFLIEVMKLLPKWLDIVFAAYRKCEVDFSRCQGFPPRGILKEFALPFHAIESFRAVSVFEGSVHEPMSISEAVGSGDAAHIGVSPARQAGSLGLISPQSVFWR